TNNLFSCSGIIYTENSLPFTIAGTGTGRLTVSITWTLTDSGFSGPTTWRGWWSVGEAAAITYTTDWMDASTLVVTKTWVVNIAAGDHTLWFGVDGTGYSEWNVEID